MVEENKWPGQQIKEIGKEEVNVTKEIRRKYRQVFLGNGTGMDVLKDILINFCHFGQALDFTQGQIADHNVEVFILNRCGLYTPKNVSEALNNLFNTAFVEEE